MRSAGSRSGVNCARAKSRPSAGRQRSRREGLAEPGVVLEQHVPLGQDGGEHQHQRVALADHGLLHLVEHQAGQRGRPRSTRGSGSHSSSIRRTQVSISVRLREPGWVGEDAGHVGAQQGRGRRVAQAEAVSLPQPRGRELGQPVAQGGVGVAGVQVAADDADPHGQPGVLPGGRDRVRRLHLPLGRVADHAEVHERQHRGQQGDEQQQPLGARIGVDGDHQHPDRGVRRRGRGEPAPPEPGRGHCCPARVVSER